MFKNVLSKLELLNIKRRIKLYGPEVRNNIQVLFDDYYVDECLIFRVYTLFKQRDIELFTDEIKRIVRLVKFITKKLLISI